MVGPHGELGTVVDSQPDPSGVLELVVRGGVSDALEYRIPARAITRLSPESRTVKVRVEPSEFIPHLQDDGTVRLRLPD